ncbi:MAG: energy transducer TonB [Azonexus sp.]
MRFQMGPTEGGCLAGLPPLDTGEPVRSPGERGLSLLVVCLLHAILIYGLLGVSVRHELIALPSSISVRLLPMVEAPVVEAKPVQPPPSKAPVRKPPVVQPQPVLATSRAAAPGSFVVASQPAPPPPIAVAPDPAPVAAPVAIVAPRFDADYLHNPKPVYPALSRRLNEEGKVLLKVRVSAQGTPLDVVVSQSSGFPRLDAAAADAVSRWRFVPARRGEEAVDSSVVVPITFALD